MLEDTTDDADESDLEPTYEDIPPDEQSDDHCIPDIRRARSERLLIFLRNLFCCSVVFGGNRHC